MTARVIRFPGPELSLQRHAYLVTPLASSSCPHGLRLHCNPSFWNPVPGTARPVWTIYGRMPVATCAPESQGRGCNPAFSVLLSITNIRQKYINIHLKSIANVDYFTCLKKLLTIDISISKNDNKKMQINYFKKSDLVFKIF